MRLFPPLRFLHQRLKKVKSNTKFVHPFIFKHDKGRKGRMADQALCSDKVTSAHVKRHMDDESVVTEDLLLCLKEVSANLAVRL